MCAIAAGYPDAAFDLLTGDGAAEAMRGAPFLREIAVLRREGRRSIASLLSQARNLRSRNYGMAVLFDRSLRSALLATIARIPQRIGFAVEFRGPLLTDRVAYDRAEPELDCLLRIAVAAGATETQREMKLWVSEEEKRSVRGEFGLRGPLAALAPAANEPHLRQWPVEHYRALIPQLRQEGLSVVLVGAPSEREVAGQVAEGLDVTNLCGQTSVRQAIQLVAASDLYVSGEIGLSHCAVALETPSVVIHNPMKAYRWGHEGEFAAALFSPARSERPTPEDLQECLRQVMPDRVMDAARRVMRKEGAIAP